MTGLPSYLTRGRASLQAVAASMSNSKLKGSD